MKIPEFVKTHWIKLSIAIGAALIVFSAVAVVLVFSERTTELGNRPADSALPKTEEIVTKVWDDLYAVVVDNHKDARPLSGVDAASFVIETPVEGGISRLLAFFERGTHIPQIGPVRSARVYFLDWVKASGPALFIHIGGSPEALSKIGSDTALIATDADGIAAAGLYFSRDESRSAPHNAYIASKDVETIFWKRSQTPRPVTGWNFSSEPEDSDLGDGGEINVAWGERTNNVVWKYDKDSNLYRRWVNGKEDKTRDEVALTAKNVVLMYTDIATIDEEGRKSIRTTGEGAAKIYINGKETDGKWKREDASLPRFYDGLDNEIVFTEGNVWIEVVK